MKQITRVAAAKAALGDDLDDALHVIVAHHGALELIESQLARHHVPRRQGEAARRLSEAQAKALYAAPRRAALRAPLRRASLADLGEQPIGAVQQKLLRTGRASARESACACESPLAAGSGRAARTVATKLWYIVEGLDSTRR